MWRDALFRDRRDAGARLVPLLAPLGLKDPLVYGLLRGGIAVGAPIAEGLKAPLLPFVVRKLGVPWQPELGFGALAEGADAPVLNRDIVAECGLGPDDIARVEAIKDKAEMARFMGRSQGAFGASIVGGEPYADTGDPTMNVLWLGQGGIGLPDREYYLSDEFKAQHDAYRAYIARTMRMVGNAAPEKAADAIMAFETDIAKASWAIADRRVYPASDPGHLEGERDFGRAMRRVRDELEALGP